MRLIDHAAGRVGADACRAAGYDGAIRYLANSADRGLPNKILIPEEAARYLELGMPLVSNYQRTKADWQAGFDGGVADAKAALAQHVACGGPRNRPIYFSVDGDVDLATWNGQVLPYLNGAASVLGREWVGVYGGQRSMWWAAEDGFRWRWQTRSWSRYDSNGRWNASLPVQWVEGCQIRQERIDEDWINGIGIDVNTTWADDFGHWQAAPATTPEEPRVDRPEFREHFSFGASSSQRWGARVRNTLWHTQEGGNADGSGVWGLAGYLKNTANGVSYHTVIGNGDVVHVVALDRASWSVLDANPYTNNICFAGSRAGWSRDQWLAREHDIKIACWLSVQYARETGHAIDVIAPPYSVRDGISDHAYVTRALKIGTHTDVGPNFPWDVARRYVDMYARGGAPAPPVNMIDQEYEHAKAWIGARRTEGELVAPDGEGRYAEFEHGYIYWHPRVGAHAVPLNVFGKWAELGWEAGPVGYPVGDHTVLKDADGTPVGDVQGFENGAIYRRYGQPGAWVHGEIRNRWNRSGFENGPWGWPTSDEVPFDTGAFQEFEHGRIYWTPKQTLGLINGDGADTPVSDVAA